MALYARQPFRYQTLEPADLCERIGHILLQFAPDGTHRVGIEPALFDRFQVGDTLEVAYPATGDLIGVRKIVLPAAKG